MKILYFLAGLVLVPACIAVSRTLVLLIESIQPETTLAIPPSAWALGGGFTIWVIAFYCLPRPVRSYVLAHELTHALWAALTGIKVHGMQVRKETGRVVLGGTNFMVVLAPYFFPLYTMLVICLYYLSGVFYDVQKFSLLWLALVGLSWGFHFTFTITTLMQHQSDIHQYGRLFSYSIIYLFNVLGITLWVVIVSDPTLEEMILSLQATLKWVYGSIFFAATELVTHAADSAGAVLLPRLLQ
jgi:hypothetical protein